MDREQGLDGGIGKPAGKDQPAIRESGVDMLEWAREPGEALAVDLVGPVARRPGQQRVGEHGRWPTGAFDERDAVADGVPAQLRAGVAGDAEQAQDWAARR